MLHSAALCFLVLLLLSGCGVMANGKGWGQEATFIPGWERVGQAMVNAAAAPETWAPALGAVALQTGNADRKVQKWAARTTPVYGSQENAETMSNRLRDASRTLWLASAIVAPGGDSTKDWFLSKTAGLAVETTGGIVMRSIVGELKTGVDRTRPNGGKGSFPSAHASGSSTYNTFASRNVAAYDLPDPVITATQIGLGALTAATSWARVEANEHYPSDVLAGIALGHFVGAFFSDAFLRLDYPAVTAEPLHRGWAVTMNIAY